jgi:hypothetical protein
MTKSVDLKCGTYFLPFLKRNYMIRMAIAVPCAKKQDFGRNSEKVCGSGRKVLRDANFFSLNFEVG